MNFERFIAQRASSSGKKSFTRLIILIATVAVALSLTVMIATSSLIAGFKKEITNKIFGFWGHIHITDINSNRSMLEGSPMTKDPALYSSIMNVDKVEYLRYMEFLGIQFTSVEVEDRTEGGVKHAQSFAMKPGIIQTKKQIEGIILKGVDTDFNWDFFKDYLEEGEIFDTKDSLDARKVLISRTTADRLNTDTGKKFIVNSIVNGEPMPFRFEVAGVYKTGLEEFDKKFALVNIGIVQEMLGWNENQISGYEVFVEDIDDLDIISQYIDYNALENYLYAETIREKIPPIFEWLNLQDLNEKVILALMLVVSIINMITALLILILERTEMIGVLKAMGTNNWSVRKVFLNYAGYIIIAGLFWGNVIGISLCLIQKHFGIIKLSEADYYLSVAPIDLNFWNILMLNVGTFFLILLFLVIPTWLVTRISPVRAIRFQ